jgi:putative acetyltransferase
MAAVVTIEEPTSPEVLSLLETHLSFARQITPAGGVFALPPEQLHSTRVTFFCARMEGRLVGVAALQELDDDHGEIKSMHTAAEARREGVGRALVQRLLSEARERGYRRVSLETGNFDAFVPARALYQACGFVPCPPYGPYVDSTTSACMTIDLDVTSRADRTKAAQPARPPGEAT